MENTEQYNILSIRIRSERRRERERRKEHDRQLLSLHRELKALWEKTRWPEYVDLDSPYQRGWERFFVLRDDVANSSDALFYQTLLGKINTRQWSYRKDFRKRSKRHGKKTYPVQEQSLQDVWESEFFSNKFTVQERRCFTEVLVSSQWSQSIFRKFRFMEPWRFVLRVQPNMVTQVRIINQDLERREAHLERRLEIHNLWPRLDKLRDYHRRSSKDYYCEKYRSPFQSVSFMAILEEHWPAPHIDHLKTPETPGVFVFISPGLLCSSTTFSYLRILAASS